MFVRTVQPAAQSDLYNGYIHFLIGKIAECHRCGQFKERRVQRLEKVTFFFYEVHYVLFGYGRAVYTDTFTEIHQVGRGVKAHAVSRLLQYMAANVWEQEPLPLVPATWIVRNERWGCPKCSSNMRVFSKPSLYAEPPTC